MPSVVARGAAGLTCLVVMLTACGHSQRLAPGDHSPRTPAQLNQLSAARAVDSMTRTGLPTLNRHDVTQQKCPELRCTEAIETDAVSVFKFPATGIAQQYAASLANAYQIEDIVLVFAASVTPDSKREYEAVVEREAA